MGLTVINKDTPNDRLSRSGTSFTGNYLDKVFVQYTLELDLRFNLAGGLRNPLEVEAATNKLILTASTWVELIGAYVGANVSFQFGSGAVVNTTVVSVNGAEMVVTSLGGYTSGSKTSGYVEITDLPKDFELKYNLVRNTVGSGTASLIDGNDVRFKAEDIDLLAVSGTITLTQLGNKSGGTIFDFAQLERIADSASGAKRYTVNLEYKIWGCISSADYFSSEALGDYAEFDVFMISADPSTKVSDTYFQAGNTGFEDENFNGNPSDYVLTSIDWEDASTNAMQAFDYTQDSNFTIVITKQSGNFNASDSFDFKMFTIPNDAGQYQNKPLPLDNNLMLAQNGAPIAPSTPTNITGNLNDLGAGYNIIGLQSVIATNTMTITGRVVPNNVFKDLFNSRVVGDRAYKIVIATEDNTLTFVKSDRVNVLADFDQAQKNLIDLGSFGVTSIQFTDHNDDVYGAKPNLYLEDDTLVTVEYTIPKLLSVNPVNPYVSIKGRIVLENTITGERFTLEELTYDISSLPVLSDGSLPLDYIEDRGFKLPATSDKREFVIERNTSADLADVFGVRMKYPFITRYEDWIQVPNVPVDFYATDTENWYNYTIPADWTINFEHVIEENNPNAPFVEGEYIDAVNFTINDYDDWGETSAIVFKDSLGDVLAKPLPSGFTTVEVTHTLAADTWSGNEWVQIHVRPQQGAPQWTGSTVLDASDNNNPLTPLTGETKTTINVAAGTITSQVRFNPANIDVTNGLTFTTRVKGDSLGGGERNNIFKLDTKVSREPIVAGQPDLLDQTEECRGIKTCGEKELKLADLNSDDRHKNDLTLIVLPAISYNVVLKKDGVITTYVPPVSQELENDEDARFVQIEWKDVATQDGFGCYTIEIQDYFLRSVLKTETPFEFGCYELKPYSTNCTYGGEGTFRILSKFNDVNDKLGIDFTNSNLYDSLRMGGKFGYNQPNTEINNTVYLDGRVEKVKREDFDTWDLKLNLSSQYFIDRLRFHLLGENECWISDHNATSPSYKLFDKAVVLQEGLTLEYEDGSRLVKGEAIFGDKVRICRTHFQNNRITAETLAPPAVNTSCQSANYLVEYENGTDIESGTIPSGGSVTVTVPNPDSIFWTRNSQWLDLPEVNIGDEQFYGLYAVFENDPLGNTITIDTNATGNTIDWGDGNTVSSINGVNTHVYDYATIVSPVLTSFDGRNYKQVIVGVDLTGNTVLGLEDSPIAKNRTTGWLDILAAGTSLNSLPVSGNIVTNIGIPVYLERFRVIEMSATATNATRHFYGCTSLKVVDYPLLNNFTGANSVFSYSSDLRDSNNNPISLTGASGVDLRVAFSNSSITEVGNIDYPTCTVTTQCFFCFKN